MPPRYQPLQVDASTYRPSGIAAGAAGGGSGASAPSPATERLLAGGRRAASSVRSVFYCACVPALFGDLLDRFASRLPSRAQFVGYLSGGLFALGWWAFIDGVTYASTRDPALPVSIRFDDWLPGILSTLSLIVY
ncbi:hypothetical protein HK405_003121, partial [Cladochytrium tenue]